MAGANGAKDDFTGSPFDDEAQQGDHVQMSPMELGGQYDSGRNSYTFSESAVSTEGQDEESALDDDDALAAKPKKPRGWCAGAGSLRSFRSCYRVALLWLFVGVIIFALPATLRGTLHVFERLALDGDRGYLDLRVKNCALSFAEAPSDDDELHAVLEMWGGLGGGRWRQKHNMISVVASDDAPYACVLTVYVPADEVLPPTTIDAWGAGATAKATCVERARCLAAATGDRFELDTAETLALLFAPAAKFPGSGRGARGSAKEWIEK